MDGEFPDSMFREIVTIPVNSYEFLLFRVGISSSVTARLIPSCILIFQVDVIHGHSWRCTDGFYMTGHD